MNLSSSLLLQKERFIAQKSYDDEKLQAAPIVVEWRHEVAVAVL